MSTRTPLPRVGPLRTARPALPPPRSLTAAPTDVLELLTRRATA
ncbi:MAG: hypothetical protein ACRELG_18220 [Gemmataceae bacterium]